MILRTADCIRRAAVTSETKQAMISQAAAVARRQISRRVLLLDILKSQRTGRSRHACMAKNTASVASSPLPYPG
jgi:hypothetical protein